MLGRLLGMQWRVLSFGFRSADLERLSREHLVYGLLVTWIAGVGRYWDHPDPHFVQRAGVGSLAIVVALATIVYVTALPLRPKSWSFVNVLTFITLTALPAWLYAIPVERSLDLASARTANVTFLAIVAVWRVALLGTYLRRQAGFPIWLAVVALLLPVVAIVVALTALNLERAVFDLMSGLRDDASPADAAYAVLVLITGLSFISFPVLFISYLGAVVVRRWPRH